LLNLYGSDSKLLNLYGSDSKLLNLYGSDSKSYGICTVLSKSYWICKVLTGSYWICKVLVNISTNLNQFPTKKNQCSNWKKVCFQFQQNAMHWIWKTRRITTGWIECDTSCKLDEIFLLFLVVFSKMKFLHCPVLILPEKRLETQKLISLHRIISSLLFLLEL